MDEFRATGIMVLLFALRCIVPLILTIGIGYALNRMADRWEKEAAAARPATQGRPGAIPLPVPAQTAAPCWSVKGCSPEKRAACPAYRQRALPCWLARTRVEGVLPSTCVDCDLYKGARLAF
jgi:hypothetical protein